MDRIVSVLVFWLLSVVCFGLAMANEQTIYYKDGYIYISNNTIIDGGLDPSKAIYIACGEKPDSGKGPIGNEWLQTKNYKDKWNNYKLDKSGQNWKSKLDRDFFKYGKIRFNLVQLKGGFGDIWFNVHKFRDEYWYNRDTGDILLSLQ